jgi:hypothetical protein
MAIDGGAIKRRWPATYSGRELVLPEASAIAMLYVCWISSDPGTGKALSGDPERALDQVLYLVAGAGFEPATFGL